MFPEKRESGQTVVEAQICLPAGRGVTVPAVTLDVAGMHIVLPMTGCAIHGQLDFVRRLYVAGLALRLRMRPTQREAGHPVMTEADDLPSGLAMTSRAVRAIAALVDVVSGMTARAVDSELHLPGRLAVARLARGLAVCAPERKARQPVMIETDLLPAPAVVAVLAGRAILPFVHVIAHMAAVAGSSRLLHRIVGAMAGRTASGCMGANQREACHAVVEPRGLPIAAIVTGGAIWPSRAFVRIILGMARAAARPQPFPALCNVTGKASDVGMGACQRKAGLLMIEWLELLPALHAVTSLTIAPELTAMRICFSVAVRTVGRCAPIFRRLAVTAGANHPRVGPHQRIVSESMVETGRVQASDGNAASLVLGVTGFAVSDAGRAVTAVEANGAGNVLRDRLVASETFPVLRGLAEGLVTARAIRL